MLGCMSDSRSARFVTLSAIGSVVAVAGFEHGVGEWLQGWVAPQGLVIQSWPDQPFYRSLQGEPALTVLPTLALSGLVTMSLSVVLLVWVFGFADRRHSALVIAGLSAALLVAGGGFGTALLGFLLAAAAVKVTSPLSWWRSQAGRPSVQALAAAWPALLTACVGSWLMALFGVAALDYFHGIESVSLTLGVLIIAFALLPVSIAASYAKDAHGPTRR